MLRLGHIDYSNCIPVHASLLQQQPAGVEIIHGTPAELNRALAAGVVDVAPCSSVEYAREPGRYRLLPGLVIGAEHAVQSIRFECSRAIDRLGECSIAVPDASATSVVLLRILLERRFNARPRLEWYTQEAGTDPIEHGFDGALWIGDLALRRPPQPQRAIYDLSALWAEWTGLPFAFALWQTPLGPERDAELSELARQLRASRDVALRDPLALAQRFATAFRIPPEELADYWRRLTFDFTPRVQQGLLRFFEYAAQLGEIDGVSELRFVPEVDSPLERGL